MRAARYRISPTATCVTPALRGTVPDGAGPSGGLGPSPVPARRTGSCPSWSCRARCPRSSCTSGGRGPRNAPRSPTHTPRDPRPAAVHTAPMKMVHAPPEELARQGRREGAGSGGAGGRGAYSLVAYLHENYLYLRVSETALSSGTDWYVACLSHSTIDQAFLSKRSTRRSEGFESKECRHRTLRPTEQCVKSLVLRLLLYTRLSTKYSLARVTASTTVKTHAVSRLQGSGMPATQECPNTSSPPSLCTDEGPGAAGDDRTLDIVRTPS